MAAAGRRRFRSKLPDALNAARRCSLPLRAAAALGIVASTGAADLPGLGPREARVGIDVAVMPWSAVARVQVPGASRCTGFILGPQTVVTAAHCTYSRRLDHFLPPASVHVLLGYADGAFTRHAVAVSFHVANGYDPRVAGGQGADIAVLTLAAPIAGPGEALVLIGQPIPRGSPLALGGYGQDRAERISADLSCKSLGYAASPDGRTMLMHDCAGTSGTSGGPILVQTSEGWRVAAVQVAGNRHGVGGSAVPAETIRAVLAQP